MCYHKSVGFLYKISAGVKDLIAKDCKQIIVDPAGIPDGTSQKYIYLRELFKLPIKYIILQSEKCHGTFS